jgi:hypothetical protein
MMAQLHPAEEPRAQRRAAAEPRQTLVGLDERHLMDLLS